MVEFQTNGNILQIRISGQDFESLVEMCKKLHCHWNADTGFWETKINRYWEVRDKFNTTEERIIISDTTYRYIVDHLNSYKELQYSETRRLYKQELLNFPPIKGKSPFENYQKEDFVNALQKNRFLFYHDVGLGKSWIAAALIEHGWYYGLFNKVLMFSSNIGTFNVKQELVKFGKNIKLDDIYVINKTLLLGEKRNLFDIDRFPQKIIIITYDVIKTVSDYYYDIKHRTKKVEHPSRNVAYTNSFIPFDYWKEDSEACLLLDECHYANNAQSRRSEIVNQNVGYFQYRYEFSATPFDQYQKMYNLLRILDPYLVAGLSYSEWLPMYNNMGNKWGEYNLNKNGWKLDKIAKLNKSIIDVYLAKRTRADCLDLPPDIECPTIKIEMNSLHREIYEMFSNETVFSVQKEKEGLASDTLLNMFQYLQLSVDNPLCLKTNKKWDLFSDKLKALLNKYNYQKDYTKIDAVDAIVTDHIVEMEQKGIIWYYHPATLKELLIRYKRYKPIVISADVPLEERFRIANDFQNSNKDKLIILSIVCANNSITLTNCKWQVYLEKVFSYSDYYQSRGRISRNGQVDTTKTYTLCYNRSIDYLQQKNLQEKGAVLNWLGNRKYLNKEMWKQIFNADENLFGEIEFKERMKIEF